MNKMVFIPLTLSKSYSWKERLADFFLAGFSQTSRSRFLMNQLESRGTTPEYLWGANQERLILGNKIGVIIKKEMNWPNSHFIPEDPMRLILYRLDSDGLFWDHMELESVFHQIELLVNVSLSQSDIQTIIKKTLGETVDFLLEKASSFHFSNKHNEYQ